jgi:hypothetical protein
MCAVGSNPPNVEDHLNYFVKHNEEVKKWVVDMAKGGSVRKPESMTASATSSVSKAAAKATESASHVSSGAATAEATKTDGVEANAAQTGTTGAAGELRVAGGYMVALAVVVAVFL